MDLEELAETEVPPSLSAGLQVARAWLDQILDGPGTFTEESIRNFNGWHIWMTSVLLAWERGTAMPACPETWDADNPVAADPIDTFATASLSGGEELSLHLNLAEDLEFLREFHGESVELLQDIEQGILVLEDNPTDAATIDSIFRAFHTFKGGAGFLHLDALRDLAHDLESLLDAVRRSELGITSGNHRSDPCWRRCAETVHARRLARGSRAQILGRRSLSPRGKLFGAYSLSLAGNCGRQAPSRM